MPKRLILTGLVQGVFCRKYCSQYGKKLKIRGAASNLRDGTVEVILETDDDDLARFYARCLMKNPDGFMFYGRIDNIRMNAYSGPIHGDYNF